MACNALARKTMSNVFYCTSMKNVTKNLLQRSALFLSPTPSTTTTTPSSSSSSSSCNLSLNNDFPLPGNVSVDMEELEKLELKKKNPLQLLEMDDNAKRLEVLAQFLGTMSTEASQHPATTTTTTTPTSHTEEESYIQLNTDTPDKVECKIEACPPSLKRGFQRLFDKTQRNETLTVLTISQHTENDMTTWSEDVEEEREALTKTFIRNATEIVSRVEECGYWADFIDPASGQPFNGSYKNESLFETDDRFNQLGFRIEDLGCCKAIAHKKWGTNVFVGVLFTNAPASVFADLKGGDIVADEECS